MLARFLEIDTFPSTNSLKGSRSPKGVPDSEIFGRVLRTTGAGGKPSTWFPPERLVEPRALALHAGIAAKPSEVTHASAG